MTPCVCALAAALLPGTAGTQPPAPPSPPSVQAGLRAVEEEFRRLTHELALLRAENTRLKAELRRLKAADGRFRDRGDHVADTKTGLLWQKDGTAAGQLNYFDAFKYATGLTLAGTPGWRLPTRAELADIFPAADPPFENTQYNPDRPVSPSAGPMPSYWSGDLDPRLPDYAFVYHWHGAGGANNCYASRNKAWVRCVHDPVAVKPAESKPK